MMSENERQAPAEGERSTERMAVIVLGVSALASSYAAFQAEVWHGEQASHYTLAEQTRTEASTQAAISAELRTLDAGAFSQWLDAYARNDQRLQLFYRARFRPDFAKIFEEWLLTHPATNRSAPLSPFHMRPYSRAANAEATRLSNQAKAEYSAGRSADQIGNRYVQSTVILALSLFLGGVTQGFQSKKLRDGVLIAAAALCLLGLVRIVALPALRLTM
jgi:hypothetical protein